MSAMAANMFVFYFGIVADITPPVALAAYAGSAIAKSSPMRTALNAISSGHCRLPGPLRLCTESGDALYRHSLV